MFRNLQVLIKPASSACNIYCDYCFYNDLAENRACAFCGMMSLESLEALVKKALANTSETCGFIFQGGEPSLVGLDFYKALIDFQKRHNINSVRIFNSIQTNAYNIDDDWAEFFKKNNFLVGVSLDGDKETHDHYRKTKSGEGSFDKVIKGIEILEKHKVDFNILSVVSGYSSGRVDETYKFFKEKGFKYLQFIPCLESINDEKGRADYHLSVKDYENFLIRLFDLWYKDFIQGRFLSIRHLENWFGIALGRQPEACNMCGRCSIQWVVESDGSVYPCDFYVLDDYKMGNIITDDFEKMLQTDVVQRFLSESLPVPRQCKECRFYFLCRNGCKRERYKNSDGDYVYYYCDAVKGFFNKREKEFASIAMYLKNRRMG